MTPAQQLIQRFLPSGDGSLNRDYKAPHANRPTPERPHRKRNKAFQSFFARPDRLIRRCFK